MWSLALGSSSPAINLHCPCHCRGLTPSSFWASTFWLSHGLSGHATGFTEIPSAEASSHGFGRFQWTDPCWHFSEWEVEYTSERSHGLGLAAFLVWWTAYLERSTDRPYSLQFSYGSPLFSNWHRRLSMFSSSGTPWLHVRVGGGSCLTTGWVFTPE